MRASRVVACLWCVACSSSAPNPTILVTNMTDTALTVIVYDYDAPTDGQVHGIAASPEFQLGQVGGSRSVCLSFATVEIDHSFALRGEGVSVDTPPSNTFVPQNSAGWTATFTGTNTTPIGPTKTSTPCTP